MSLIRASNKCALARSEIFPPFSFVSGGHAVLVVVSLVCRVVGVVDEVSVLTLT